MAERNGQQNCTRCFLLSCAPLVVWVWRRCHFTGEITAAQSVKWIAWGRHGWCQGSIERCAGNRVTTSDVVPSFTCCMTAWVILLFYLCFIDFGNVSKRAKKVISNLSFCPSTEEAEAFGLHFAQLATSIKFSLVITEFYLHGVWVACVRDVLSHSTMPRFWVDAETVWWKCHFLRTGHNS